MNDEGSSMNVFVQCKVKIYKCLRCGTKAPQELKQNEKGGHYFNVFRPDGWLLLDGYDEDKQLCEGCSNDYLIILKRFLKK